ncbi:MAG TPA: rRNA maturation RNase YbeY [Verrucomicrobiae bacterium]|nr:rRNA maturation RNase YbeY [Verrucomicrobiae bacterium]
MKDLQVRNRQRARAINLEFLRAVSTCLLEELLLFKSYALAVHLVSASAMSKINREFLAHEGATDVITFDLQEGYESSEKVEADLIGEIFICVPMAQEQARQFSTSWQEEITRYLVHGVLHLLGLDDSHPKKRRAMKIEENRLVKLLKRRFKLASLGA